MDHGMAKDLGMYRNSLVWRFPLNRKPINQFYNSFFGELAAVQPLFFGTQQIFRRDKQGFSRVPEIPSDPSCVSVRKSFQLWRFFRWVFWVWKSLQKMVVLFCKYSNKTDEKRGRSSKHHDYIIII